MSFEDLGLSTELLRAVQEQNYSKPTPIQAQAIPAILDGRDILAGAQTGTGKTASFTLPLLHRMMETFPQGASQKKFRPVRALIVAPTRELANQVADSVQTYAKHLPIRSNVVFGGVKIAPQIFKLRRGVDVLVATPGRLLDLVNQRVLDLSQVETLVLDEADRMLDMGFMPDIKRILALMPKERQNLLFSATYSNHIKKLAGDILRSPKIIDIGSGNSVATKISHIVHPVNQERKRQLLSYLIDFNGWKQVLVFTKTKRGADRLAKQLDSDGLRSVAIHGDKTQGARSQALHKFKQGRVRVMVATDVAARGLDINQLSHVVNYELPMVAEDYIHRIGRTGRAGNKGEAISLVGSDERHLLQDIERLLKKPLQKSVIEGYEPDFSLAVPAKSRPGNKNRRPQQRRHNSNRPGSGNSRNGNRTGNDSSERKQRRDKPSGNQTQNRSGNSAGAGANQKPRRPRKRPSAAA